MLRSIGVIALAALVFAAIVVAGSAEARNRSPLGNGSLAVMPYPTPDPHP
jgi:hypothetical protein